MNEHFGDRPQFPPWRQGMNLRIEPPAPPPGESAYRVEIDDSRVCEHCGAGAYWDVVGPDGVALGTSYSDKADAEEMAAALSLAYDKGREAERAA